MLHIYNIYFYMCVFVRLRVVSLVSCGPLKYKSVAVSKW